jgi:hypothetical protein
MQIRDLKFGKQKKDSRCDHSITKRQAFFKKKKLELDAQHTFVKTFLRKGKVTTVKAA